MNRPRRIATLAALCLLPTVTAAAAPNIQPVLLPNQPLPDASGDLVGPNLLFLQATSLSRNGDVAVTIRAYDPSSSTPWFDQNLSATLLWSAGSLSTLVHTGDTLGDAGAQVISIGAPVLSPDGRFLAVGVYEIKHGPDLFIDNNNAYVWDRAAGPGPSTPVLTYPTASSIGTYQFQVNNAGVVAATAYQSNDVNVLTGPPGHLQPIVTTGSLLPSGDTALESHSLAINPAGQVLLTSTTDQNSPSATGIYLATPAGTLQTLAARNAPAPGIPDALFSDIQTPTALSDSGRTAFAAAVVAPGLHTISDQGVWAGSPGSLHLLAREGDPAPNTADRHFASFSNPAISPDGHVAFLAGFASSPDGDDSPRDSLWLTDPTHADQLAKVAATGDPAPGTTGTFSNFSGFSLGNAGLIAFTANALIPRDADDPIVILANLLHLDPSPITTTGLWIGTPGDLHLLLQKDDPFDLNGQTMYAVAFNLLGTGPYGNGNPLGLTDDGRLLLSLSYRNADSTLYSDGLFLLSLPEPSSLCAACGLASLLPPPSPPPYITQIFLLTSTAVFPTLRRAHQYPHSLLPFA